MPVPWYPGCLDLRDVVILCGLVNFFNHGAFGVCEVLNNYLLPVNSIYVQQGWNKDFIIVFELQCQISWDGKIPWMQKIYACRPFKCEKAPRSLRNLAPKLETGVEVSPKNINVMSWGSNLCFDAIKLSPADEKCMLTTWRTLVGAFEMALGVETSRV